MSPTKDLAPRVRPRGLQKVTMEEIARLCGTTKMTVSRVFSGRAGVGEELRVRILDEARRLNYVVNHQASSFSSNRVDLIGLATPFEGLLGSRYFQRIVEGLNRGLNNSPHDLVLFDMLDSTFEDGAKLESAWRRRKVDGLVILAPHTTDGFIRPLVKSGVPLVVVGEMEIGLRAQSITADEEAGVKEAVDHLFALGHRRLAFVGGPVALSSAQRRRTSFINRTRELGLSVAFDHIVAGDYTMRSGRELGASMLRAGDVKRPTAIMAANDYMALGVIQSALAENLRVPADLSVVGFDDLSDAAEYWPPLTTVHQPIRSIGETAARILLSQIQPSAATLPPIELICSLVVRESTGSPPVGAGKSR